MSSINEYPVFSEHPDDEFACELSALGDDCQDLLEQDERYRSKEKLMRIIAPEWATNDGIHYHAFLRGSHAMSPEGRPVGQDFELGLQVAYPLKGLVPAELQDLLVEAEAEEELPPVEDILGIVAKFMVNIELFPNGTMSWNEQRQYAMTRVANEEEAEHDMSFGVSREVETPDGIVNEYVTAVEVLYVVPRDEQTAGMFTAAQASKIEDSLKALEQEIMGAPAAVYVAFGRQILSLVMSEDETALGLSRIFPEDVVNRILQIS